MRTMIALIAIPVLTFAGVFTLKDATEYDGGVDADHETTRIVYTVETRGLGHDEDVAAEMLWRLCIGGIHEWDAVSAPRQLTGESYAVTIRPALADETVRRITGCISDLSVDNVIGDVTSATNT